MGNLTSAILSITPFFAIFIYYKNFEPVIFVHAVFLFLLISMKELTKDLENIKGDLVHNYKTIPIAYGEYTSKLVLTSLAVLTLIPSYLLVFRYNNGEMDYYFYFSIFLLVIFVFSLWRATTRSQYVKLHNLLKFIIVAGVICIVLIKPSVVINRI